MAAVTICSDFGAQENKVCHCFIVSPSICHEVMGPDAMIFVFWMLSFKPTFSLSTFTFIKRLLSSSSLSAIRVVSSAYLRLLIFLPAILISACVSSSPAIIITNNYTGGFPGGSDGKESACSSGDPGLILGLGRSPEEGNGNPFQYSCLENSRTEEPGGLHTVHGVAKSLTGLND